MQVNAVKHNVLKCKNLNIGTKNCKNMERFFILIKYNVAYYLYFLCIMY